MPEFAQRVAYHSGLPRVDFDCQLIPFGSYGIGGYIAGADMDLVLLSSYHVERRDFLRLFPALIKDKGIAQDVEVCGLSRSLRVYCLNI